MNKLLLEIATKKKELLISRVEKADLEEALARRRLVEVTA